MTRKAIYIFLPLIAVLLITTIQAAPFDQGDMSSINSGDGSPINPINESHIEQVIGLANPAATYCVNHRGSLRYAETPEGTVGYCDLPDGTTCEEWAFYHGECGPSINPKPTPEPTPRPMPGCDKIVIQGKVTSISQSRSFTIYVDTVLQGYGLDGTYPGFKLVPGVTVETTSVYSSYPSINVGDCVEVSGKWCTTDSPPIYLGDPGTHIKKITCPNSPKPSNPKSESCLQSGGSVVTQMCCKLASDFPNTCLRGACGCSPDNSKEITVCDCGEGKCFDGTSCVDIQSPPQPSCTLGPTGNCKCLNGEIWNEYQNEDCTREWRIAEDCKNRGPNWSCENCQCAEACEDRKGFEDTLKSYKDGLWKKSEDCGKESNDCPDHIEFPGGSFMSIRVDKDPCSSSGSRCSKKDFFAGGYQTKCKYGYGHLEGYLRPAAKKGVVTGFFLYEGLPNDSSQPRAEIDIEFLADDTTKMQVTKMQVNYWRNGIRREPPVDPINLGFDASLEWHKYAIDWSKDTIKWSVDGKVVWTEDGKNGWASNDKKIASTTPLPTPAGIVILNLYPNEEWAGELNYKGPIYAYFKDIKYSPG